MTNVIAKSSLFSLSVVLSQGIGIAADGDSLAVAAVVSCISSLSFAGAAAGGCGAGSLLVEVIERTTSFLQIGQVRRRVVSHGVLDPVRSRQLKLTVEVLTCNRRGIHDHRVNS